nr:hypothetical protein [Tanacetum cinerariifolium]
MSAKRTSWNEFSSAMASAVIYLSTGRKFNFSKYIFDSLVRNVDSNLKFYMYPRFIQLIIQNQLGDLLTHTTKYISPALTQNVFANMRRVGKGCSGVETPLFEGMLVVEDIEEYNDAEEQSQGNDNDVAQGADADVSGDDVQGQFIPSPAPPTPPPPPQDIPSTSQVQSPLPQTQSPTPAQPQVADFPMSLLQEALDACAALTRRVEHLEHDKVAQDLEITKLKTRVKKLERANKVKTLKLRRLKKVGTSHRVDTSDDTIMEDVSNQGRMIDELDRDEDDTIMEDVSNQGRMIDELDRDEGVALMGEKEEEKKVAEVKVIAGDAQVEGRQAEIQAEIYQIDMDHPSKVLSMHDDELEVQEVVEVVTTAKIITEVVTAASAPVSAASKIIPAAEPNILAATITAAPVKSKDKGKGIMVEEHKTKNKMKQKAKEDPYVQRYQKAAKRRRLDEEDKDVEEIKQHLEIVSNKDDDSNVWKTIWTRSSLEESKKCPWSSKERRYPLLRFTLDQMLNAVRLQVEKQSEMSLELISFGVDAIKELKEKHQVFNAASEELCAAKQKLMLLA